MPYYRFSAAILGENIQILTERLRVIVTILFFLTPRFNLSLNILTLLLILAFVLRIDCNLDFDFAVFSLKTNCPWRCLQRPVRCLQTLVGHDHLHFRPYF